MSIPLAIAHVDSWHERKKFVLDEEKTALNTACISFVQFLREEERREFSLREAVLDAALSAALAAVPGALVLSRSWKAAARGLRITTQEGEELLKLATEKGYDAARDLGQKVDNEMAGGGNGRESTIKATQSEFIDQYLIKKLRPLRRARMEALVVWETWREILAQWDESAMGDPHPLVTSLLPKPTIPQIERHAATFRFAAEYHLIGAYVQSNVVVEIIPNTMYTKAETNVRGLNNPQLQRIFDKFSAASVRPRSISDGAFDRLEVLHRMEERLASRDKQFVTKAKSWKQWRDLLYETGLKDVNEKRDLVSVWGAREVRKQPIPPA